LSLFTKDDYAQKKQTTYSPKTRLPTESKTKKHKCSQCDRTDAKMYLIGNYLGIRLCPIHKIKFLNQFQEEKNVNFVKAGRLRNE